MPPADEKAARQLQELQVKLSDFDKVKLIGRGAYGEVQLVRRDVFLFVFASQSRKKKGIARRRMKAADFLFASGSR